MKKLFKIILAIILVSLCYCQTIGELDDENLVDSQENMFKTQMDEQQDEMFEEQDDMNENEDEMADIDDEELADTEDNEEDDRNIDLVPLKISQDDRVVFEDDNGKLVLRKPLKFGKKQVWFMMKMRDGSFRAVHPTGRFLGLSKDGRPLLEDIENDSNLWDLVTNDDGTSSIKTRIGGFLKWNEVKEEFESNPDNTDETHFEIELGDSLLKRLNDADRTEIEDFMKVKLLERIMERRQDMVSIPSDEDNSKFFDRLRQLLSKKFDLENPSADEEKELSELSVRLMKFYNKFMRKVLIQSTLDNRRYLNPKGDKDNFEVRADIRRFPGLRQTWSLIGPNKKKEFYLVSALGKYLHESDKGELRQVDTPTNLSLWKFVQEDDGTFNLKSSSGKFVGLTEGKDQQLVLNLFDKKSDKTRFAVFQSLISLIKKSDEFDEGQTFGEIMKKLQELASEDKLRE